ncbi:MAG: Asp-tRNA(Asn)/Glu-tRNA(Gln) amidotransferase subunit GatC [Promethearchaeia archaeon]
MTDEKEFSKDSIDHISKLALLDLSDDEKEQYASQLNDILDYFTKLEDLDTTDVEPTTHTIEDLNNQFRKDKPWKSLSSKEALKNADEKKDGYIKAPRILKE